MQSKFNGGILAVFLFSLWFGPLMLITLGLAFPWVICIVLRWIFNNSIIGGKRLSFKGSGGGLFGHFLLWWFLTIITFGIYGYWAARNQIRWVIENIEIADAAL